jgi:integration host factor subunit beta
MRDIDYTRWHSHLAHQPGTRPMTKSELVERLLKKGAWGRGQAEGVVEAIFECLEKALRQGERIEIRGLGTFQVRSYKGYEGRNPKTGTPVHVSPKRLPFFKGSKNLVAKIGEEARRTMSLKMPKITPPTKQAPLRDPTNQVGSLP